MSCPWAKVRPATVRRRGGIAGDADEADPLEPAVAIARVQPERLELGGDIAGGDLMAAAAGVAAFEQIVGEEGDMGAKGVGAEIARARVGRLGEARDGQRQRGQAAKQDFEFHGKTYPRVQPTPGGLIHKSERWQWQLRQMNGSQPCLGQDPFNPSTL